MATILFYSSLSTLNNPMIQSFTGLFFSLSYFFANGSNLCDYQLALQCFVNVYVFSKNNFRAAINLS
jgi:hypothetical protein